MNISVLMSIYNKENPEYFEQCMLSIWDNQTLKPTEIVLVQDGPLPPYLQNTVELWRNKLGSIMKVVKLETNVGLGRALNEGLKYCSCDWVFRMDTDDICSSDRFKIQTEYIKQNNDIVLLGSQIKEFDDNMKNEIGDRTVPINNDEIYKKSLFRNPFNHMTVAYKKEIIRNIGGYNHHLYMEDYNLWLRLIASNYRVANLPDILVYVRTGKNMYQRRKGMTYINSELKLAHLKYKLKLQNFPMTYIYFILRVIPRLLPSNILGLIYLLLRKK